MRLNGKTALVVGAGSIGAGWGNGKATAVQFARQGAQVVCFDVNPDAAQETAAIVQDEGGQAMAIGGDATSSIALKAAVEACVTKFGRLDILHNNVGIIVKGGVVEIDEDSWDHAFDVNL